MKQRCLIVYMFICFTGFLFGIDQTQLWGVWNLGDKSGRMYNRTLSTGVYERTFLSLGFDSNFYNTGNGAISYNGGYYIIDEIFPTEDGFRLFIHCKTNIEDTNGNFVEETVAGVVAVHFLSNETIWLELIRGSNTHQQFPTGDFSGKDVVLWRGKLLEASNTVIEQK